MIDQEIELLQIAARTPAEDYRLAWTPWPTPRWSTDSTAELAGWIKACASAPDVAAAGRVAAIGIDALIGRRTSRIVFHSNHIDTTDNDYVTEWTEMIAGRIEQ